MGTITTNTKVKILDDKYVLKIAAFMKSIKFEQFEKARLTGCYFGSRLG